jgi:hypothetical protein
LTAQASFGFVVLVSRLVEVKAECWLLELVAVAHAFSSVVTEAWCSFERCPPGEGGAGARARRGFLTLLSKIPKKTAFSFFFF